MDSVGEEYSVSEMYRLGMDFLIDRFGIVNTEKFLAAVKTSNSDYTKWRQHFYDDMTVEEFDADMDAYAKANGKEGSR
ncbi:MAG: hypothetical protein J5813_01285 [Candidatus Methanomethylophilaceae archaeon]|nr:hypothetical protein [Candidatus Methanomethylophilaceae archaeon]